MTMTESGLCGSPTMRLRVVKFNNPRVYDKYGKEKIDFKIQQLWKINDGSIVWLDVETVNESEITK